MLVALQRCACLLGIVACLVCTRFTCGSIRPALRTLVFAYTFAWAAHKFVEENRPATFIYPIFSLWGDFPMFGEVLMGMHEKSRLRELQLCTVR